RYAAQDVRQVDHAGRADGDQGCAGVVEEWQAGQHADGDAGPDRSVQPRVHAAEHSRHWQLAVTRHAERQPDGRGLDREAADVDGGEHDEEIDVRGPAREVRLDDGDERERNLARVDVADELAHVAGDGDDDGEQDDRTDERGPDD